MKIKNIYTINHDVDEVPSSQSYGLSRSHVWMWELDSYIKKAECCWRTDAIPPSWIFPSALSGELYHVSIFEAPNIYILFCQVTFTGLWISATLEIFNAYN